jgi:hypothetical protein
MANSIFKHDVIINHRLVVNYNIPTNIKLKMVGDYIDVTSLNNLNNSDSVMLFYIVFNLNRLLDYNTGTQNFGEITNLVIRIIKYIFNLYYIPYNNNNVRKFDFIIHNKIPYIEDTYKLEETVRVVGDYNELESINVDDKTKEQINEENYDYMEAKTSLDIDDYEKDDDIDGAAEALDGYED